MARAAKRKRKLDLDGESQAAIAKDPGMMVAWYLMSSFLYYTQEVSLLSDHHFDLMCKRMLDEWETLQHPHKVHIDVAQLAAGTGYAIEWDTLPGIVKSAAERAARELN